jgi:hypothetical protein
MSGHRYQVKTRADGAKIITGSGAGFDTDSLVITLVFFIPVVICVGLAAAVTIADFVSMQFLWGVILSITAGILYLLVRRTFGAFKFVLSPGGIESKGKLYKASAISGIFICNKYDGYDNKIWGHFDTRIENTPNDPSIETFGAEKLETWRVGFNHGQYEYKISNNLHGDVAIALFDILTTKQGAAATPPTA